MGWQCEQGDDEGKENEDNQCDSQRYAIAITPPSGEGLESSEGDEKQEQGHKPGRGDVIGKGSKEPAYALAGEQRAHTLQPHGRKEP